MIDVIRKLTKLLSRGERHRALLLFVLMIIMGFLEMLGVASIMPFVAVLADPGMIDTNHYLSAIYTTLDFNDRHGFLVFLGCVVLGFFVFSLSFKSLTGYAILRFSMMRLHTISCRVLGAYLRQPYTFFLGCNTAALGKTVLSEVEQVTNGGLLPLLRALSGSIVVLSLFILLMLIEPIISLIVATLLGGAFFVVYVLSRVLLTRIGLERVNANRKRFILANEALNGIKELRLLGRESAYLERFRIPSEQFARSQARAKVIGYIPQYGIQAIAFGGVLVLVLYLLVRQNGIEGALPLIALYAFAGYRLMPASQEVFKNFTELRFAKPAMDVLCNDLAHKEGRVITDTDSNVQTCKVNGDIILDNVNYRYPGSEGYAVQKLSLTIPRGSSAAFVGTTGAGKSTVIDIILGLLEPSEGQVLVGGQLLIGTTLRAWQRNIGYVPQSIYLADDTVAANIAFGINATEIDMASVERAARIAHIHEFIVAKLPSGYDTKVGERGIRLSGGERQRLAIARALYHDPEVVVFDEATSALDNATEVAVMEAIEELHKSKTILLIAHRLTTVRSCNQIHIFSKGRLDSSGSYAELMAVSAPFRALVDASITKSPIE